MRWRYRPRTLTGETSSACTTVAPFVSCRNWRRLWVVDVLDHQFRVCLCKSSCTDPIGSLHICWSFVCLDLCRFGCGTRLIGWCDLDVTLSWFVIHLVIWSCRPVCLLACGCASVCFLSLSLSLSLSLCHIHSLMFDSCCNLFSKAIHTVEDSVEKRFDLKTSKLYNLQNLNASVIICKKEDALFLIFYVLCVWEIVKFRVTQFLWRLTFHFLISVSIVANCWVTDRVCLKDDESACFVRS